MHKCKFFKNLTKVFKVQLLKHVRHGFARYKKMQEIMKSTFLYSSNLINFETPDFVSSFAFYSLFLFVELTRDSHCLQFPVPSDFFLRNRFTIDFVKIRSMKSRISITVYR